MKQRTPSRQPRHALPIRQVIASALCGGLSAISPVEAAEASPNENQDDVPIMVVTATRNAIDTTTAPASVSVVDSKAIEERPVVNLTDAIKDLPGLVVRDNNGVPSAWSQQIVVRGIPGNGRNAVLIDGQPLNNSFSNGVNWSLLDPQAVERIEVVRGPFSSLYGGAAMGGVVNIITKAPTTRELEVQAGYGTDELSLLRATYADRISERVALRADLSQKRSGGIIEDEVMKSRFTTGTGTVVNGLESTNTPEGDPAYRIGDKGRRAWEQQNAGLNFSIDTGNNSKLSLGARYHTHETRYDGFNTYLTNGATGEDVTSGNVAINDTERFSLKESDFLFGPNGEDVVRLNAAYERAFGEGATLKLDAFQSRNAYWYVTPTSGVATDDGGTGKLVNVPNERRAANATVSLPLTESHFLVTGVSLTHDSLHKREHLITDWQNPDSDWSGSTTFRGNGENRTWAVFMQDEIAANQNLMIYAGLRYDSWTTRGDFESFGTTAFSGDFDDRRKSALSPKISAVYTPSNAMTLRASVGDAFNAPTLSDMYSTWNIGSTIYFSNPDLDPETIRSYEVGGERRFANNLHLSATLFHNELRDMIHFTALNDGTNNKIAANVARAESQGVELALDYPFTANARGFLNYTLAKTKVLEDDAAPESVGKQLTQVPEQAANVGMQVNAGRVSSYVVGRYAGKMYGDSANLDTSNGVYGSYDPYFVIDTKVGYALSDAVVASLSVTNLLDRTYYAYTRTAGRTVFAELVARF